MTEVNTTEASHGTAPDSLQKRKTKKHSSVYEEFKSYVLLLLFIFVIRSSVLGLYVIPTGSMLPTIKIDDRLIANKLAYGLMLPFGESQVLSWSTPKRGEIVLFKSPEADFTFVKRVMGVAGDVILFRDGVLTINGEAVTETRVEDLGILEDMGDSPEGKVLYRESGYGGPEHYMLRSEDGGPTFFESREFIIPEGKLFLLGDNRDGSSDSRVWGMVDADKIYGRALTVFYSTIRHDGWLPKFRADRFFQPLQ